MLSNCLTYEQLHSYSTNELNVSEKEQLYKHISHCELCSCAVNGFAAVPFTMDDVVDIDRSIQLKVNPHAAYPFTITQGIIATLSITSIFLFYSITNSFSFKRTENSIITVTEITNHNVPTSKLITSTIEIASTKQKLKKAVRIAKHKIFEKNISPLEYIMPIKAEEIITATSIEEEEPLLPHYNSEVIYLYDLKISDYNKLYFGTNRYNIFKSGTPVYKEHSESIVKEMEEEIDIVPADQLLKQGLVFFNKEQYAKALSNFNILLGANKEDINARFYAALSYYNMNNYSKAIEQLNVSLSSFNNTFHPESEWYLAMSYLKSGDKEKAKEILETIASENGFYKKKAIEKLKKI